MYNNYNDNLKIKECMDLIIETQKSEADPGISKRGGGPGVVCRILTSKVCFDALSHIT